MLEPTTPKQREGIYEDVRSLLVPGFLSSTANVGDTQLAFRSPNAVDFFLLQNRVGQLATEQQWRAWMVASCTWMIDGQIVLGNQAVVRALYECLVLLPRNPLITLFYIVVGLTNRTKTALDTIEAFGYESSSRALWHQIGSDFETASGFPSIGRNSVQQVWVAQNEAEDLRNERLNAWECAKLTAAPHANKAIKRMNQSDEIRRMEEDQRRQEVMDRAYYRAKGYKVADDAPIAGANLRFRTKSRDELAEEYRQWVQGERDFHDEVVTEYKRKIRDGMLREIATIREQQAEFDREVEQLQLPASAPQIVGYTADQVREILRERGGGRLAQARQVLPEGKRFRNFERFIQTPEKPSNFSASDVFRSEGNKADLNERIAQRRPQLRDLPREVK